MMLLDSMGAFYTREYLISRGLWKPFSKEFPAESAKGLSNIPSNVTMPLDKITHFAVSCNVVDPKNSTDAHSDVAPPLNTTKDK